MNEFSVINLADTCLMVVRAEADLEPQIKAAWRALESRFTSLKRRKFFGVCFKEDNGGVYYAGLVPESADEVASLGLPTLQVKGGRYVRFKLQDWSKHTDQIARIVDKLEQSFPTDPTRPVLEYYRSSTELHLLAPLKGEDSVTPTV